MLSTSAAAAPPAHQPLAETLEGFNHACGVAVDSEGDVYVSSAGETPPRIRIFNSAHVEIGSIEEGLVEPCGLAVDSDGDLYVSESATGNVVRYEPNEYPFTGSPTYNLVEPPVDPSGEARGIAVDPFDDRLYVARGNYIQVYQWDGSTGQNEIQRLVLFGAQGGTYTLGFSGSGPTAPIPSDAPSAPAGCPVAEPECINVQEALESLPMIGAGNVQVEDNFQVEKVEGEYAAHLITFTGSLASANVVQVSVDDSGLVGGAEVRTKVQGFAFDGRIADGELTEATGVAAYTYKVSGEKADRYVFAADAATDQVRVFSGDDIRTLKLRRGIAGIDHDNDPDTPDQEFGFGEAGAYLAVDPGNVDPVGKCDPLTAEQACTAGHFLVYDAANEVIDEFEANGEFLDQIPSPEPPAPPFADAKPTAMAVDRSGGPNEGTVYVTAGAGAGAEVLGFGPLAAPRRPQLGEPLSRVLAEAQAVATDFRGNVYVGAGPVIHLFSPSGAEIPVGPKGKGIEDEKLLSDLAVDSKCNVYVLDGSSSDTEVTYYTPNPPSACPPKAGTDYIRHEPPVTTPEDFPKVPAAPFPTAIAVNPANDHLFVTTAFYAHEHGSAAEGSPLLDDEFAPFVGGVQESIAVHGASGNVYFGSNPRMITVVDDGDPEAPDDEEILARINGAGSPDGQLPHSPVLTVDQSNGHVIGFADSVGAFEYDAAGGFIAKFGNFTSAVRKQRVAIDSSCALHDPPLTEATTPTCGEFAPGNGNVYVAYDDPSIGSFDLTAFGPLSYGDPPLAATGTASGVGDGNATLNGTVDPLNFDLEDCHFEYLTDAEYEANKNAQEEAGEPVAPFATAVSTPCTETLEEIGKGSEPVAVHADLLGLDPDERYRYRLLAENKFGLSEGNPWLFGPPLLTTKSALPVLYDEATLRAEIDPSGLATEYRFQYIDKERFEAEGGFAGPSVESTLTVELPPGDGSVAVQAPLVGLTEGTLYHFRVLVENEAKALEGPDQTFETQERLPIPPCPNTEYRTGLSAKLPDCRAYELVTPAETGGLGPYAAGSGSPGAGFNNWLTPPSGAAAGESLSYFINGTLPGFDGTGRLDGYRAERGAGDHPSEGWRSQIVSPSYLQTGGAAPSPHGVASDQRYSFWSIGGFKGTFPFGVYLRALDGNADPACAPLPGQLDFELVGCGSLGTDPGAQSRYLSPGGGHLIFASKAHLEPEAPPAGTTAIYDRTAGASSAEVVSVKPDGSTFAAGENATYLGVTDDGSAVAFEVDDVLFLRHGGQETIEIADVPNAIFAGISEDGSRVFYAEATSGDQPGNLFVCDTQAGPCVPGPEPSGLTAIAANSIFVHVPSADPAIAGPGESGARVYFTSQDEQGGEGVPGADNLYLWDGVATRFIAVLDPRDLEDNGFEAFVSLRTWTAAVGPGGGRGRLPARSTPDGGIFVFQSHAQLTSYDNTEATAGACGDPEAAGDHCAEVYRYDTEAGPGDELICVSCNPIGAPPSGDATLVKLVGSPVNETTILPNVTAGGTEVFFQSPDPLLPEDANSVTDVYKWQRNGVGGCKRAGGCLALISSGQGEEASFLYGMSADGRDVFFRTKEKLVGQDVPGSSSIYDARIEGGIPDPPAEEDCQGDACQGQGSTPPSLPSPASADISGEGNVTASKPSRCAKAAKAAKRNSARAKRLRRAARRASGRRAEAVRRRARHRAKRARRLARSAKRCRARQRRRATANRRAGR